MDENAKKKINDSLNESEINKKQTPVYDYEQQEPQIATAKSEINKDAIDEAKIAPINPGGRVIEADKKDDPFDLSKLRLSQEFTKSAGTKKLLTTVPVRKPNRQHFIRTHSSSEYRGTFALIKLSDDRDAFYLIVPEIAKKLPGEFFMSTVFTAINRQGVVFLWPVRLPAPDGRTLEWHRSEMEAAERAMEGWLRVKANMSLGANEMFEPDGVIPNPDWSDLPSFQELISIGFRGHLVDRLDHAVVQRLRGK
jgi:hypothetical protein